MGLLERFGLPVSDTPVVVLNGRHIRRNPDTVYLPRASGLRPAAQHGSVCDLLVVRSGSGRSGRGGRRRQLRRPGRAVPRRAVPGRLSRGSRADLTTDSSRYLIDQLEHHDRVHIVLNAEVVGLSGERRWPALTWSTTASENTPTSKPRALFVFIVASGNTLIVA